MQDGRRPAPYIESWAPATHFAAREKMKFSWVVRYWHGRARAETKLQPLKEFYSRLILSRSIEPIIDRETIWRGKFWSSAS